MTDTTRPASPPNRQRLLRALRTGKFDRINPTDQALLPYEILSLVITDNQEYLAIVHGAAAFWQWFEQAREGIPGITSATTPVWLDMLHGMLLQKSGVEGGAPLDDHTQALLAKIASSNLDEVAQAQDDASLQSPFFVGVAAAIAFGESKQKFYAGSDARLLYNEWVQRLQALHPLDSSDLTG